MAYITAKETAARKVYQESMCRYYVLMVILLVRKKVNLGLILRNVRKPVDTRSLRYNSDSREGLS